MFVGNQKKKNLSSPSQRDITSAGRKQLNMRQEAETEQDRVQRRSTNPAEQSQHSSPIQEERRMQQSFWVVISTTERKRIP